MKSIALILFLLLAGVFAQPHEDVELGGGQERITVTNRIQRAVNNMNQAIIAAGNDPFQIGYRSTGIDTPIGRVHAHVKGLECTGLSHNKFDRLSYNAALMRLTFDLVWPEIACVLESTGVEAEVLGRKLSIWTSGELLKVVELRVAGTVRVQLRLGRVVIRDCDMRVSAELTSDMKVEVQGQESHKYNSLVAAVNKHLQENQDTIGLWMCEKIEDLI